MQASTVVDMARMAHLRMPEDGAAMDSLLADLNSIVGWIGVVQTCDTSGVEPMISPHFEDSEPLSMNSDDNDPASSDATVSSMRPGAVGTQTIISHTNNAVGAYFHVPKPTSGSQG